MTAGAELKRRRQAADLSQQALAVALDVSLPIVSRWERDVNTPRRDMAQRIDDQLDAGGALVAAFGYVSPPVDDPLAALQVQVAELVETVEDLGRLVKAQGAEMARLARRSRPPTGEASGGRP